MPGFTVQEENRLRQPRKHGSEAMEQRQGAVTSKSCPGDQAYSCPCPAGQDSSQPPAAVPAGVSLLANSTNMRREDTPSAIPQLFLVPDDFSWKHATAAGHRDDCRRDKPSPLCQDCTGSYRCQPRFEGVTDKHMSVPSTSSSHSSSILLLSFPIHLWSSS